MFENEGDIELQNSPISPTLFPHFVEKEGPNQTQNTNLSERCHLLSIVIGEGSKTRYCVLKSRSLLSHPYKNVLIKVLTSNLVIGFEAFDVMLDMACKDEN